MATTVTARQLPGRLLRLLSVVIASIAIALVALTISPWRPDDASPAPGDGASTNSAESAHATVLFAGATSQPLVIDSQRNDVLASCLTTWRYVSAQTEIQAAGLEQFVESGCGAP